MISKCCRPDVTELVHHVNHEYRHWDRVRHYKLPPDLKAEELWYAIMLSRATQFQTLPLLDDKLRYWCPSRHQEWLHFIDRGAGGLIDTSRADTDRFVINSLMEEAIASSKLEGASTTRVVAKEMLRTNRKPRDKHEQMIVNNYNAILEIRELKNEMLTPKMLCHIHEIITEKTLDNPEAAGRFKNASDHPVEVVDTTTNEVLFKPPSHNYTEYLIDELCDFANATQNGFIHPVVKAIALHFAIGYIHPFVDGNGRTARAIFYWFMLKSGYWIFEYLPISRIVLDSPGRYVRAYLYAETDGLDLTYFIHYHLRIVVRAVKEVHEWLLNQKLLTAKAKEAVSRIDGLNHRQAAVAYEAIHHPNKRFTIKLHAGAHQIATATARADLFGLEEKGVLQKKRIGREWVFFAAAEIAEGLESGAFRPVSEKTRQDVQPIKHPTAIKDASQKSLFSDQSDGAFGILNTVNVTWSGTTPSN